MEVLQFFIISLNGNFTADPKIVPPNACIPSLDILSRHDIIDPVNVATDRLSPGVAHKLIRKILKEGQVSWSMHAKEELANDSLTIPDCANVLRAGVVEEPELIKGTWRYRVRTQKIFVVVAFRSGTELSIVTAWRVGKS